MACNLPGNQTCRRSVRMLLDTLHGAGYQAYVVGGCVRDSLLGRTPEDWDICTSARPDETEALFAGRRLLLNGKRHGTVAVVLDGHSWEITTFRQDGAYSDGRHPRRRTVCAQPARGPGPAGFYRQRDGLDARCRAC